MSLPSLIKSYIICQHQGDSFGNLICKVGIKAFNDLHSDCKPPRGTGRLQCCRIVLMHFSFSLPPVSPVLDTCFPVVFFCPINLISHFSWTEGSVPEVSCFSEHFAQPVFCSLFVRQTFFLKCMLM